MITDNYLSYKPAGYSYRVDDHIFAGGYPVTEWDEGVRRSQVRQYTDFGITDFVDLTEAGREMPPYNMFLPEGIRYHSFPVPDRGVPDGCGKLTALFDMLCGMISEYPGTNVYIHCHGGAGRTGTVVSCYYVYMGMDPDAAVAKMQHRYATNPNSRWYRSPENDAQVSFVRTYHEYITGNRM